VQEYILARRVEVWSNGVKLQGRTAGWLHTDGLLKYIQSTTLEPESPAMRIVLYRQKYLSPGRRAPYSEFQTLVETFETNVACADARDRVYALLSLLSSEGREQLAIVPDYTKSTSALFLSVVCSFARLLLRREDRKMVSTSPHVTHSDLERLRNVVDIFEQTESKGYHLPYFVQRLQSMLSLAKDDTVVQSVWGVVNQGASSETKPVTIRLLTR
jgi:hypothetical protein